MPDQDKTPKSSEADDGSSFGQSTRRSFISRLGMAGVFASAARIAPASVLTYNDALHRAQKAKAKKKVIAHLAVG
jgi:hypothetical protein